MVLYEIAPMRKLPRKEKRSKELKAVIKRINDIVSKHWAFIGGYQMKNNKVRVLADFSTMGSIRREIVQSIKTKQLDKVGIRVIL